MMKRLIIGMTAWSAVVGGWILGMHMYFRDFSVGPEERTVLVYTFATGCVVVPLCLFVCPMLRRAGASLTGFAFGLVVPVLTGFVWALLPESFPSLNLPWSAHDSWANGYMLAVPSGVAGILVGLLLATRATRPPREESA